MMNVPFGMSFFALRPFPPQSVWNLWSGGYWRFVKRRFWHLSAFQHFGEHSFWSWRFVHSSSQRLSLLWQSQISVWERFASTRFFITCFRLSGKLECTWKIRQKAGTSNWENKSNTHDIFDDFLKGKWTTRWLDTSSLIKQILGYYQRIFKVAFQTTLARGRSEIC